MIRKDLRGYCRSLVRSVTIPVPFSANALAKSMAAQRGRRLYIHPLPTGWGGEESPCGIWISTEVADHIFFEEQTSPFHQEHIILHELGHMICGHTGPDLGGELDKASFGEVVDHKMVQEALLRTSYNTDQEKEAELVATLLLEKARKSGRQPLSAQDRWLGTALGLSDV